MEKNLPAMWDTWVRSLGWEDPLEKGMATHSSIPAWRIPWTEGPGRLQYMALKESDVTERLPLSLRFLVHVVNTGKMNIPLNYNMTCYKLLKIKVKKKKTLKAREK